MADGRTIVVDIDLEKFFDKVNHDILMARLGRWVGDKRMLRIIGRFLGAGLMQNGVCVSRDEGTPQGGPLSPLLANLLLDDLDKELGKRGHRGSAVMPTTAISMCNQRRRGNECWRA